MNSATINNSVFAPLSGAGLPFSEQTQSDNNDFQALFKAHMLGGNSAEPKVESRTMAFGMRRGDVNPFIEPAKLSNQSASFNEQFKKASQVSEKANTNKSQSKSHDLTTDEKNVSDRDSQAIAEEMTNRTEKSDRSPEKMTDIEVNESEQVRAIEAIIEEGLAAQEKLELVKLLGMLEEKISELTESADLDEEVAAKLAALVAELQTIVESVELSASGSEKLVELATMLKKQLDDTEGREALIAMVQQSESMIELASAVLESGNIDSAADYLKKLPELQKTFAAAGKSTEDKLPQADVDCEDVVINKSTEASDGDMADASELTHTAEARKKATSEAKQEQTVSDSKSVEQLSRQNLMDESAEPSLRQKHEMLSGGEEISQEASSAEETSTSVTGENAGRQQAVSVEKAETVAQSVAKHIVNQNSDNNSTKDGLSAKKIESSLPGSTATESINQKSDNDSQNSNGQNLASGSNYNNSGLTSAKSATPQINHTHFAELLEKAELLKTNNGKQILSLEMTPEELGKLEMELTSRDGILTARISADNMLARAKLEEMASQIKENLLEQGINLTEITVDISSKNPDEQERSAMFDRKNKSKHGSVSDVSNGEEIIRKNILPNLRRAALNIKAVDLTV